MQLICQNLIKSYHIATTPAYDAFQRNIRDRSKIRVKCEIEANNIL